MGSYRHCSLTSSVLCRQCSSMRWHRVSSCTTWTRHGAWLVQGASSCVVWRSAAPRCTRQIAVYSSGSIVRRQRRCHCQQPASLDWRRTSYGWAPSGALGASPCESATHFNDCTSRWRQHRQSADYRRPTSDGPRHHQTTSRSHQRLEERHRRR